MGFHDSGRLSDKLTSSLQGRRNSCPSPTRDREKADTPDTIDAEQLLILRNLRIRLDLSDKPAYRLIR